MKSVDKAKQGLRNNYRGRSSESTLTGIFQDWDWTAGKPEPDMGVDLIVQTDFSLSFAAQVKSKTKKATIATLKHEAAARIRDQSLPAYLFVHARTENEIYWVYLEPLLRSDADFLAGRPLKVEITPKNRFSVTEIECPPQLSEMLKSSVPRAAIKAVTRISDYATEFEKYYAEIDPRFKVTPYVDGGKHGVRVQSVAGSTELRYCAKTRDPRAPASIKALMDWGSEVEFQASMEMQGSNLVGTLFPAVSCGQLTLSGTANWSGTGMLRVDGETDPLLVHVVLRQGRAGLEFLITGAGDCFKCRIRFPFEYSSPSDIEGTLNIDFERMFRWPASELTKLDGLSSVLDALISRTPTYLKLVGHPKVPKPIPFKWTSSAQPALQSCRDLVSALESMNRVANQLGIALDNNPIGTLTDEEVDDWLTYDALLQGNDVQLANASVKFETDKSPESLAHFADLKEGLNKFRFLWSDRVNDNRCCIA